METNLNKTTIEQLLDECQEIATLALHSSYLVKVEATKDNRYSAKLYPYNANVSPNLVESLLALKEQLLKEGKSFIDKRIEENQYDITHHQTCLIECNNKIDKLNQLKLKLN